MRRILKLAPMLVLAGFGGYVVWTRYGDRLQPTDPDERRVSERAELNVTERAVGSDDPQAQAEAILADSDARTALSRSAPGVERRQSEDTVEP